MSKARDELLTAPSHYLRVVLRKLEEDNYDVDPLLEDLGISREVYQQPDGLAPTEQAVALIIRVWEIMDDEFWGLSSQRCKPGLFALMVRYIGQFNTLHAVLKEMCRFYRTTRDDVIFNYQIDDTEVKLFVELSHPEVDADHYLVEFLVVCFHRLLCWLSGKKIALLRTEFAYARPAHYHPAYKHLFPCEHLFNRPRNLFAFSLDTLKLPLIRNMEEINDYLLRAPAYVMSIPGSDDSYNHLIRGLVLRRQRAGEGFPDFGLIASQLCMSPPTLRRKLKAENTSYQQIKDVLRRDLAIDKLMYESLSVAEIGHLLGFVEPASFTRAFKQWTGVSPAAYRLQTKS